MGQLLKEIGQNGDIVRDRVKNQGDMAFIHPPSEFYVEWLDNFMELAKMIDELYFPDVTQAVNDMETYSNMLKSFYRDTVSRFKRFFDILETATDSRIKFDYDSFRGEIMGVIIEPEKTDDPAAVETQVEWNVTRKCEIIQALESSE